ncbi:MAG: luciferase [Acidimicrobiales bacterium]|nr:luciferase [Acidimicrobiales bacterium]
MRHALFLPIFDELADPRVVRQLAAEAEENDWDGVFVWDHLVYSPPADAVADPWITMAAIASATERIRLGPLVTPLPRRRPLKVAREVVTLDLLSAGRFTLGVGIAGDRHHELSGSGEELDARERGAMLDEALDVLTEAWKGEPVHHRGPHYVADGLALRPRPVQRPRPPIWVGARYGNAAPLRRAARYEGVFPVQLSTPEQLAELVATVAAERRALFDDRGAGGYDVIVGLPPGTDPRPYEAAGATWWLEAFSAFTVTEDEVRGVIRDGPRR